MLLLKELLEDLNDEYDKFNLYKLDEDMNRSAILVNGTQDDICKYTMEHLDEEVKMVYNDKTEVNIFVQRDLKMEVYEKKTPREHILERPNMYIGASNFVEVEDYLLINDKLQKTTVSCIPGLLKIINEIIDNSVDIAIKTDFKGCNVVSIKITNDTVTVEDNGPGIAVKKNSDGEYFPFVCWGYAMAGSNFNNDSSRVSTGLNGLGSFCSNVWSKEFTGISDDGTNRYTVKFKDNASSYKESVTKTISKGVTVKFKPDLERFGITEIDSVHKDLIYLRL